MSNPFPADTGLPSVLPSTGTVTWNGRGSLQMVSDGKLQLLNAAGSIDGAATELNGFLIGPNTNAGGYLTYFVSYTITEGATSGTTAFLELRNGDKTKHASLGLGDLVVNGNNCTLTASTQGRAKFTNGSGISAQLASNSATGRVEVHDDNDALNFILAEGLLSSTSSVDLNTSNKTTLLTPPTGKTAVVTRVVVRNASTSLTTASFGFGQDASATDYAASATHTELTGATLYSVISPKSGATVVAAAANFGVKCSIVQGSAATATIDVFGYMY